MKLRIFAALFSLILVIAGTARAATAFRPGDLVVLRVGNGKESLANTGNSVFLDEYTTNGVFTNSIAIPTNGITSLIIAGSASSEGAISRSPDLSAIALVGYNTDWPYSNSLSGATAASVPRGIGTVNANGIFTFITNTTAFFSGNNIRGGVTDGSNNFWAAGATNGTVYMGVAAPATTVQSSVPDDEVINIFNGSLCFSEQKTTPYGIYTFTGAPAAADNTATLIIASGDNSSPFGFAISPDGKTAYVADDRAVSAGGGIQKYTNSNPWKLLYTLGTGAGSTNGARGLTVSFSQPPVLYATTADAKTNRLIAITDTGAGSVTSVLAVAPANEIFRGVQFTPEGAVTSNTQSSFIAYSFPGSIYGQNFDSLPDPGANSVDTGNPVTINGVTYSLANPFDFAAPVSAAGNSGGLGLTTMSGWYGLAAPTASVGVRFGATDGDQTSGGQISFGPPNSSNRALGLQATSSTGYTAIGAKFLNKTSVTLNSINAQVTGQIWRQSNLPKTLECYYWIDPTDAAPMSTEATAYLPPLDVSFPTVAADIGGAAVDGTASVNQISLAVTNQVITNWPPGAALWLVWEMADATGKAQGLAIDNLSFSATPGWAANPPTMNIQASSANQFVLSWPATASGFQLYAATNLAAPVTWTLVTNAASASNGTFYLTLPPANATARFFRLSDAVIGP